MKLAFVPSADRPSSGRPAHPRRRSPPGERGSTWLSATMGAALARAREATCAELATFLRRRRQPPEHLRTSRSCGRSPEPRRRSAQAVVASHAKRLAMVAGVAHHYVQKDLVLEPDLGADLLVWLDDE